MFIGNNIELYGTKLIHLYDPPHLIKGVRNNLMNKDLEIEVSKKNTNRKFACWRYLELGYDIDTHRGTLNRILTKITDEYIIKNKIKKMKVKFATQLFSKSVSAYIQLLSDFGGKYIYKYNN